MRWTPGRRSRNLEDRRGERRRPRRGGFPFSLGRAGGRTRAPGRIPLPRARGGRMGIGGILFVLVVLFVMSRNPELLGGLGAGGGSVGVPTGGDVPGAAAPVGAPAASAEEERLVDFVSFVLDDLQATWKRLLPGYRDAKLVLFRDSVRSACGFGQAASGPFYCPADEKVYIDLSFYDELHRRFGAPGDFAQAYVLAHEIGHHVQRISGIEPRVRREQQRAGRRGANDLSVRLELQADCLAGVWAHAAGERGLLETGDVEEGLGAAAAIGDDRIQRMSQGHVVPEAFTHGSSEQRVRWFRRGLERGDPDACDAFSVAEP